MRLQLGHKYCIDWDALLHAIITGLGAAACIYLNTFAAVSINGVSGMSTVFLFNTAIQIYQ